MVESGSRSTRYPRVGTASPHYRSDAGGIAMIRQPSMLRPCEVCGKEMRVEYNRLQVGRGKYCSRPCMALARSEAQRGEKSLSWKGGPIPCVCAECGRAFEIPHGANTSTRNRGRFCSTECRIRSMTTRVDRVCETCGGGFTATPSQVRAGKGRWCSKPCRGAAISTHRPMSCDQCGAVILVKGYRAKTSEKHFCNKACWLAYHGNARSEVCAQCGKALTVTHTTQRGRYYCSRACAHLGHRTRTRHPCQSCGQETLNIQYCSLACWSASKSVIVQCETCGIEMKHWQSRRAVGKGRYCSRECYQRSWATNGPFPIPTSKLEHRVRAELDRRGATYQTDVQLYPYWPDLLFPDAWLIVEIDGDYWHTKADRQEEDQKRDTTLRAQGYEVLRIWEHEIKADLSTCVDRIQQAVWARLFPLPRAKGAD